MKRITLFAHAALLGFWFIVPKLDAQAQGGATAPPKQFEVASVKPAVPGSKYNGAYLIAPGGRFLGINITVERLIQEAFDVRDFQIFGGPSWITSERYDIEAKAEGWASPEQLRPLVQSLLADRFKLAIHRETKELPIYVLVVGKGGPKVQPSKSNAGPGIGGARGRINARQVSMAMFAGRLGLMLGRFVEDRTGLTGEYDIRLEWNQEDSAASMGPDVGASGSSGPSIFAALQEQLGLRLEAQKGQVPIIVIDSVQKASEN